VAFNAYLSVPLCPSFAHFASCLCVEDEVQLPSCQTTSFSGKLSSELIWPTLWKLSCLIQVIDGFVMCGSTLT